MRTIVMKVMWLLALAAVVSCSPEEKSPAVQKLEASELHQLGTSCAGAFFAFDGNNLIMLDNGKSEILQKDVKFADVGAGAMTGKYPAFGIISKFHSIAKKPS